MLLTLALMILERSYETNMRWSEIITVSLIVSYPRVPEVGLLIDLRHHIRNPKVSSCPCAWAPRFWWVTPRWPSPSWSSVLARNQGSFDPERSASHHCNSTSFGVHWDACGGAGEGYRWGRPGESCKYYCVCILYFNRFKGSFQTDQCTDIVW